MIQWEKTHRQIMWESALISVNTDGYEYTPTALENQGSIFRDNDLFKVVQVGRRWERVLKKEGEELHKAEREEGEEKEIQT